MIIFSSLIYYTCGLDRKYRVLVSVCMYDCLCVCVCVCVCVFLKYMSCGVNHAYTVLLWGPQILWGNILLPHKTEVIFGLPDQRFVLSNSLEKYPTGRMCDFHQTHTCACALVCAFVCIMEKDTHTCKVASPDGYPTRNTLSNQSYFHSASTLNKLLGIFMSA